MSAIKRIGPCRFFFYSNERGEPPHIHVQRERCLAKFWLDPVALSATRRFAAHELNRIESLVVTHQSEFLEAWHEHHER